jgi:hypothetical protein
LYCLDFVAILPGVIGPRQHTALVVRHGGRWGGRALAGLGLIAALVWTAAGCREAVTQPNTTKGPGGGAPLIVVDPAQDTTVDSVGSLNIVIAVHDPAYIDSVSVVFQGAAPPYQNFYPNDTLFQAIIPVTLGPLKHTTWSFTVSAANILGLDTTTASVNVRVR